MSIAFGDTSAGAGRNNDSLFTLLRRSSLKRDDLAPIYPPLEVVESWEQRRDISSLRQELQDAQKGCNGVDKDGKVKDLRNRIKRIEKGLEELAVHQARKEYFEQADALRGQGKSTEGLVPARARPCGGMYHTQMRDAATIGSRITERRGDDDDDDDDTAYLKTLIDYLCRRPLPGLGSPDIPSSEGDSGSDSAKFPCLLCEKNFSARSNLTRHTVAAHVNEGTFKEPFRCPKCPASSPDTSALIHSPPEWSGHVERCHGLTPPNLTSHLGASFKPAASVKSCRSSPAKATSSEEAIICLLCDKRFHGGRHFSRHFTCSHTKKGQFSKPFPCPKCQRNGVQTRIDDEPSWWVHVRGAHELRHRAAGVKRKRKDCEGNSPKRVRVRAACERCRATKATCDDQDASCGNCAAAGVECILPPGRRGIVAERRVFSACASCRVAKRRCAGEACRARSLEGAPRFASGADIDPGPELEPAGRGRSPGYLASGTSSGTSTPPLTTQPGTPSDTPPIADVPSWPAMPPLMASDETPPAKETPPANIDPRLLAWGEVGVSQTDRGMDNSDKETGTLPAEHDQAGSDVEAVNQRVNGPEKGPRSVRRSGRIQGRLGMENGQRKDLERMEAAKQRVARLGEGPRFIRRSGRIQRRRDGDKNARKEASSGSRDVATSKLVRRSTRIARI